MPYYNDERQRKVRVGIESYTNQELTLDVIGYSNVEGKLGIGSIPTNSSPELYVDGDGYFTGVVTATTFYAGPTEITGGAFADDLTANTLLVTGVSTFTGLSTFVSDVYVGGTLYVGTLSNLLEDNINLTGIITASRLSTGSTETGINIYQDLITGPEVITIDPTTIGDNTGAVVIKGDLYIEGEQFYVNSTTIELADFNVGIATTVGTNVLLDGAGIGIGSTNIRKTLTYDYSSDSLKSSENFDLDSGKVYKIDEVEVLSSSQLTVPNIYSSGIGTIETLDATTGTIDKLDLGTLRVSGISTFTNGPVFVGSGTSTGTIDQKLQVTGGAYISSNLGIGTTQPTEALEVAGNVKATEFIGIGSQISNITFRQLSDVDGSNLVPVGAGTTTPDYLVIYDPNTDSFRFVDPKTYFGINNDFNPDPIIVDYGTY